MAYLPRDEVLPGGAVVVRGGVIASFQDVVDAAQDSFDETQRQSEGAVAIYGLSVCSLPDLTAGEIMAALDEDKRLPNKQMRQTTVAKLRGLGYDVLPSGWRGH